MECYFQLTKMRRSEPFSFHGGTGSTSEGGLFLSVAARLGVLSEVSRCDV